MTQNTEGNVDPNTGTTNPQIDVVKMSQDLQSLQDAYAEKDKQYKGLQTTYNTLHKSHQALMSEKETLLEEKVTLSNQLTQFQSDQGNFKAQFDQLSGKYEALEKETNQLKQQGARKDLIVNEFPELLSFEQKGLLPEFDGDAESFKAKLSAFKETLTTNFKAAKEQQNSGAGPDATDGDNSKPNRGAVLDEMLRIAGDASKIDRYRALQAQLDEIDAKADK